MYHTADFAQLVFVSWRLQKEPRRSTLRAIEHAATRAQGKHRRRVVSNSGPDGVPPKGMSGPLRAWTGTALGSPNPTGSNSQRRLWQDAQLGSTRQGGYVFFVFQIFQQTTAVTRNLSAWDSLSNPTRETDRGLFWVRIKNSSPPGRHRTVALPAAPGRPGVPSSR